MKIAFMQGIRNVYGHFMEDSLRRNSLYMIASTFVMGGLGFFFWFINARLFSAEAVGLGSTLVSVIGLITGFSMLGFNASLVRYLPGSTQKNKLITTTFTVTTLATLVITVIFVLGLHYFSPPLLFLQHSPTTLFLFFVSMVVMNLFVLVDSVFIAFRSAQYILLKNTVFSVLKLGLPFLFLGLGALGIFYAWSIAAAIGFIVVLCVLLMRFRYELSIKADVTLLRDMFSYSAGNFIAGFLSLLPLMVLPLIVTNVLGPATAAYYYIAVTIANLLFVIPRSVSNSLFAEGSHAQDKLSSQVKKTIRFTSLLLIPATLLFLFFGKFVLLLFGQEYSTEGFVFLQLLCVSSFLVAGNVMYESILRVQRRTRLIILVSFFSSAVTLVASVLLIRYGLTGIGVAWISGQAFGVIAYFLLGVRAKSSAIDSDIP